MRSLIVRIGIIKERIDIKGIPLTPHVGERRRPVGFDRRTPDKEIGILIAQVIQVETVVHQFALFQRMMVGHIPTRTETLVISLLTIAFIREKIHSGRHIEIPDSPCMREIDPFIQRIPNTGKYTFAQEWFYFILSLFPKRFAAPLITVLSRISIDAHIGTGCRGWRQTRALGTDIDYPVQGGRAIKHRRGSFHHLYLVYILHRDDVPINHTVPGTQGVHAVNQYRRTGTHAIHPAVTSADRGLFVIDIHTGHGIQGRAQVSRCLPFDICCFQ